MKNNPEDLKSISEVVITKLVTYLEESQNGRGKVLVQKSAKELAQELQLEKWIREGGFDSSAVEIFMDTYLSNTQHMHHPHYVGHQVAVPHIASGIADFIHGVVNNPMAIYEMGPSTLR